MILKVMPKKLMLNDFYYVHYNKKDHYVTTNDQVEELIEETTNKTKSEAK